MALSAFVAEYTAPFQNRLNCSGYFVVLSSLLVSALRFVMVAILSDGEGGRIISGSAQLLCRYDLVFDMEAAFDCLNNLYFTQKSE
ncbi:hypothetical protein [Acaryochloris marina]|uniref:hypothetical protein n=1 Tax=Acaryochloris marina TaxID=155978 RepID=UPI001BAF85B6|nr:hypothetical protein [Acaryochloris marina]QUY44050.1 hypothetical protein I1H34_08135 [Acaryochloris marina S15]